MQTMQQERAKYALEQVLKQVEAAKTNGISQKEFKSYAAGFPSMIRMNGLGQAAAFYRSKGAEDNAKGQAYRALYNLLSGWLKEKGQPYEECDLLVGITSKEADAYRATQAEALLLLDWVKKFAKAYMEEKK